MTDSIAFAEKPDQPAEGAEAAGGRDGELTASSKDAGEVAATVPSVQPSYGYDAVCLNSIRGVMDIFGGKWAFLVLEQLHVGTMRFGELRRALGGVSTKSLTDTLRHLEAAGIVSRTAYPTVPITVEYALTEKGRSFDSVLLAMKDWGSAWL